MIRWTDCTGPGVVERYRVALGSVVVDVYRQAERGPWFCDVRQADGVRQRQAFCRDAADAKAWALTLVLPLLRSIADDAETAARDVAAAIAAIVDPG